MFPYCRVEFNYHIRVLFSFFLFFACGGGNTSMPFNDYFFNISRIRGHDNKKKKDFKRSLFFECKAKIGIQRL